MAGPRPVQHGPGRAARGNACRSTHNNRFRVVEGIFPLPHGHLCHRKSPYARASEGLIRYPIRQTPNLPQIQTLFWNKFGAPSHPRPSRTGSANQRVNLVLPVANGIARTAPSPSGQLLGRAPLRRSLRRAQSELVSHVALP